VSSPLCCRITRTS